MSRAEDLAKELFPDWKMTGVPTVDGQEESMVRIQRVAYIKGYHQAKKDNELTWEDVNTIIGLYNNLDDKMLCNPKRGCKEILKLFKERKEK